MTRLDTRLTVDEPCPECGFKLWEPIAVSPHSRLGLYNDDRFPGRCILVFNGHKESLLEVVGNPLRDFMEDVKTAMKAVQEATGCARVNMALLQNREPHLHAHLIPRFPEAEQFPDCSPWNDPRPKGQLGAAEVARLKERILAYLTCTP